MKMISKIIVSSIFAMLLNASVVMAQTATPIIKQRAHQFEFGHFSNDRKDMIIDTLVTTTVEVAVFADSIRIHSEAKQIYVFGTRLERDDNDKFYSLSVEAIDQDGDFCNVFVYFDKILNLFKITIAYNNVYVRYFIKM